MKTPALGLKAGRHRLGFDKARQLADGFLSGGEPKPDDPRQPAAPKRPRAGQAQLKPRRSGAGHAVGDALGQGQVDVAKEPNGEVEVRGRRPAKGRRDGAAFSDVRVESLAVSFGQRQPEKLP